MQNRSYQALRQAIGILGICLPLFLIIGSGGLQESISDYYYTRRSILFTGILFSFGLILITYKGSESSNKEYILTNIAGFFALLVALIPTIYNGPKEIKDILVYAHVDNIRMWTHNLSAVFFILLMGIIVWSRFPKPGYFVLGYRILAVVVFIGLGFAIFAFIFKAHFFSGAIFLGETVALWGFGFAWLRRGIHHSKKITNLF